MSVVRRSGDGFVLAADGKPRWGRYGAAGVLVRCADGSCERYLVAERSAMVHRGGTWAVPGGAIDLGEEPLDAALREFAEEVGIDLAAHGFRVAHIHHDDHGAWAYWTVVVEVDEPFDPPETPGWETSALRWCTAGELRTLPLFDAFEATLVRLSIL